MKIKLKIMEQFSLEKYLENQSRKVVTRDGRSVRILCTDAKAKDGCCIIAAIETDGEEEGYQFFEDGKAYSSKSSIEDCADLFFADEEEEPQSIEIPFGAFDSEFIKDEYLIPEGCEARIEGNKVIIEKIKKEELTEFDYAVLSIISDHNSHTDSIEDFAKRSSKKLLDLVRKELFKEQEHCVIIPEDDYYEQLASQYQKGQQDALKDMPKCKKATESKNFDNHVILFEDRDRVVLTTEIYEDEYYIELDDLKTLPKEE